MKWVVVSSSEKGLWRVCLSDNSHEWQVSQRLSCNEVWWVVLPSKLHGNVFLLPGQVRGGEASLDSPHQAPDPGKPPCHYSTESEWELSFLHPVKWMPDFCQSLGLHLSLVPTKATGCGWGGYFTISFQGSFCVMQSPFLFHEHVCDFEPRFAVFIVPPVHTHVLRGNLKLCLGRRALINWRCSDFYLSPFPRVSLSQLVKEGIWFPWYKGKTSSPLLCSFPGEGKWRLFCCSSFSIMAYLCISIMC